MSQLEQNTTSLDEVLAMVNALPDAGGGGVSLETCTFKYFSESPMVGTTQICYLDKNMNYASTEVRALGAATLIVLKNSILVVHGYGTFGGLDGDCEILGDYNASMSIYVTGDCRLIG